MWFDLALLNKNIKEGEQFKGIHWQRILKQHLHHLNHSKT